MKCPGCVTVRFTARNSKRARRTVWKCVDWMLICPWKSEFLVSYNPDLGTHIIGNHNPIAVIKWVNINVTCSYIRIFVVICFEINCMFTSI